MLKYLRLVASTMAAIGLLAFGIVSAHASTSGAHFFNDTSASVGSGGQLLVSIDEGGLGNENINYDLPWSATAVYACINGGGNHPKATNKETTSASGDTSVSLQARNGRVQATVPIAGTPPGPGGFSCPSGQTLVLASVSYSVTVMDLTNGVNDGPLTASATFFKV